MHQDSKSCAPHQPHPQMCAMRMAGSGAGVFVWVLVLSLSALVACEQCKPDSLSPCKADCNGTTFDLSAAFKFP